MVLPEAASPATAEKFEIEADGVPLTGIDESIENLVELYGGTLAELGEAEARFTLPLRRGVAVSGDVRCSVHWQASADGERGTVRLRSEVPMRPPKLQRVLLLIVGVSGALLWTLWPFFPAMGALSWIGGAVAFATYFLTVRQTGGGIFSDFLERLVALQNEPVTPTAH